MFDRLASEQSRNLWPLLWLQFSGGNFQCGDLSFLDYNNLPFLL